MMEGRALSRPISLVYFVCFVGQSSVYGMPTKYLKGHEIMGRDGALRTPNPDSQVTRVLSPSG